MELHLRRFRPAHIMKRISVRWKKYTVVRHCRSYTLRIKNQFILKKNIFKCYFWRNKYTRIAIFWLCNEELLAKTCICQFMKTIKHIPIYAVTNLKFIHKIRGRGIKLCIPVFFNSTFQGTSQKQAKIPSLSRWIWQRSSRPHLL